jgi:hypothetical protein
MAVSRSNDYRERPPFAVAGQMKLGRQPAPAAAESLVTWVLDPLFASA